MRWITPIVLLATFSFACARAGAQDAPGPAASAPAVTTQPGKLAHIDVDVKEKEVRVECVALRVPNPLEFFCVTTIGPDHETILRTGAKPSDIHLALLMLGLEPGKPVNYAPAAQKWLPPHGPPLHITCEWEGADGMRRSVPAYRMMRNLRTKQEMPPTTWMFVGSRLMPDGVYAADGTGYVVSVVNFDLTVIDVPALASNANETLEWETNPDVAPEAGAKVTMILSPAGKVQAGAAPAQEPNGAKAPAKIDMPLVEVGADGKVQLDRRPVGAEQLTEALEQIKSQRPIRVRLAPAQGADDDVLQTVRAAIEAAEVPVEVISPDEAPRPVAYEDDDDAEGAADDDVEALRRRWHAAVAPHDKALREAAQAHYDVINELRREQQRLIDRADRLQRLIDQLERDYQDMTTPRPQLGE
ncbi:MAG: YdjY domain-containing protein [Tepidisphaeraceae bacterium]